MRIIQINTVYKYGSTGKLVEDLHLYYQSQKIDSFVFYGRGKREHSRNVIKISTEFEAKIHGFLSRLFANDLGYSIFSTLKAIKLINKYNPDIVHLHCLNGHYINAYILFSFLKKKKINTVLTLHSETMHTSGCEHACECKKWLVSCEKCPKINGKISGLFCDDAKYLFKKMYNTINDFEKLNIVGVSKWLTERAKLSPIFINKNFYTVKNGLDVSVFNYSSNEDNEFKVQLRSQYLNTILFIVPDFNHKLKGGNYINDIAKKIPQMRIVIIGKGLDEHQFEKNILPIGYVSGKKNLARYYSNCDVTLLLSKMETFSMVLAESLCCGTPVVGFKSGAPETITIKEYSKFVDYADVDALVNNLISIIDENIDKELISKKAIEQYSVEKMAIDYLNLYNNILLKD